MPIYKKEVLSGVRKKRLRALSNTRAEFEIVKGKSKFVRKRARIWGINNTSFKVVDNLFGKELSKFIDSRLTTTQSKLTVLDWGCYDGRAAIELARNPQIKVFGFSIDAHPNMLNPGEATFLHTGKPQLIKYLKKNKIKLDLIYSKLGMTYLSSNELVSHISQLRECLNIGGKIFSGISFNNNSLSNQKVFDAFRQAGFSLDFKNGHLLSLTRIK